MDVPAQAPLAGLKVLVVGINYAPELTGIAPYTTQACEHLAAQGAQVHVLAGVPHYPHWTVPAEYRRRRCVREVRAGVPVHRLRHVVPGRQTAFTRGSYEATFGAQVLAERLPWSPDVVLAVVPSLFGSAAAARIARHHDARFVVWVQDLMGPATAQSGIAGGSRITAVTTRLEAWVLGRADSVLVLNDAFRRYVEANGVPSQRVVVVPNWSHVLDPSDNRSEVRARMGWGIDEVVALHSGNMGLKQGLENVVDAARLASDDLSPVRFVLMGDGSQREDLERRAHGISALQFLPSAAAADFTDILAAADVLLVNERASALDMCLPSKLTSYFRAGRPVVAAVPDGGTAREVARSGGGMVAQPESPTALLSAVKELASDSARAGALGSAGREHALTSLGGPASLALLVEALASEGST